MYLLLSKGHIVSIYSCRIYMYKCLVICNLAFIGFMSFDYDAGVMYFDA